MIKSRSFSIRTWPSIGGSESDQLTLNALKDQLFHQCRELEGQPKPKPNEKTRGQSDGIVKRLGSSHWWGWRGNKSFEIRDACKASLISPGQLAFHAKWTYYLTGRSSTSTHPPTSHLQKHLHPRHDPPHIPSPKFEILNLSLSQIRKTLFGQKEGASGINPALITIQPNPPSQIPKNQMN